MRPETDRRPVIAVVIKGLGIGGAEKLIVEGARFWDRAAFDYRVLYMLPWKDQLEADFIGLDIPVHCLNSRRGTGLITALRLRTILREWQADVVHAHLPWPGILARLVAECPVVHTEHNLASSYRILTRVANRLTYQRNSVTTAVSEAVLDSLSGYPGPDPELIANGVAVDEDEQAAETARRELGLTAKDPLVVHVGNIRPGKGHDVLVEATELMVRDRPDITVVTIGAEKSRGGLDRLRVLADRPQLSGRLRVLGRRADALSFIAACHVYINPSDVEGLPVSVLEAMALARPIVATAVGGVSTLIDHRSTGLLVPPGSPIELAKSVLELLDSGVEAVEMGRAAQEFVGLHHGLATMVESFETIYRRLL